jgi:Flp pilus assembly protein TadB
MKILKFIWAYLKDWKNWLVHSIIGVLILSIAFFLPVKPLYRIIILIIVVTLNVFRMKWEKSRKNKASGK